ncbi:hypothetical protein BDN70DRAFT_877665 [Pholiota conissans]|uniref:Uncharacterized protein n=1 Tax=Pholiota conissans TaxID=109636 RepID=A0A9P5Z3D5_9AGAR|nr:hypothetical protein BDN70DRAFT_877665 [Pholiota conissans]
MLLREWCCSMVQSTLASRPSLFRVRLRERSSLAPRANLSITKQCPSPATSLIRIHPRFSSIQTISQLLPLSLHLAPVSSSLRCVYIYVYLFVLLLFPKTISPSHYTMQGDHALTRTRIPPSSSFKHGGACTHIDPFAPAHLPLALASYHRLMGSCFVAPRLWECDMTRTTKRR